jgi:beta-glucosidase
MRRRRSLEAWYAGSDGANAVGNVLFGDVNPPANCPTPSPKSDADLPHPTITQPPPESRHFDGAVVPSSGPKAKPPFQVTYDEGLKVGYKWYDAEKKPVLFPFGFGLSYTTYRLLRSAGNSRRKGEGKLHLTNTGARVRSGDRRGLRRASGKCCREPPKRLVGFSKVQLKAGEKKTVEVEIDPKYLSIFDEAKDGWTLIPGDYTILVGGSSDKLPLKATVNLK